MPRNQHIDQVYLTLHYQNIMTAPYDDSTQKEWKERKGKIEGYYREMGQVGTAGNEKVSSMKPCRLAKNQRASYQSMYLSQTQERKNSWLIKHGMHVSMIYYSKSGKRFRFSREVKLTSKNYKSFCFSTPWEKRIDPDDLFKP